MATEVKTITTCDVCHKEVVREGDRYKCLPEGWHELSLARQGVGDERWMIATTETLCPACADKVRQTLLS